MSDASKIKKEQKKVLARYKLDCAIATVFLFITGERRRRRRRTKPHNL